MNHLLYVSNGFDNVHYIDPIKSFGSFNCLNFTQKINICVSSIKMYNNFRLSVED